MNNVVMSCVFNPKEGFWLRSSIKKGLSVPERHNFVPSPMYD